MNDIHVGCGVTGIHAGRARRRKDGIMEFTSQMTEVTDEVLSAAAQWLLQEKLCMTFDSGGKTYRLEVKEVKE